MTADRAGRASEVFNPLVHAKLGGYRFLGKHDDGIWRTMVEPGNAGHGLLMWSLHRNCGGCGFTIPQMFTLVPCTWQSIYDSSDMLAIPSAVEPFYPPPYTLQTHDAMGPMISISSLFTPETQAECLYYAVTADNNIVLSDGGECPGDWTTHSAKEKSGTSCSIEDPYLPHGNNIGLVPVMNVIPIDEGLHQEWMPQLLREWNNGMYAYALANYHFCWCYETECDLPDDCTVKDWDWSTVKYTPENQEEYNRLVEMCACPYHILMAEFDRMETDRPDFTDAVEGPLYDETWHYALDRYFTGWKAVFEACPPTRYHQRDERTAWLTSYSQSWSPFWGPYGLGDFQRKHGLEPYAA